MQNLKIERKPMVFSSRKRTVCTLSGEISGLCAFYQAVSNAQRKGFRINQLTPKLYNGTARGEVD